MEDLVALFKSAPLEATGVVLSAAGAYLWKRQGEKKEQAESRQVDAREIERLTRVVDTVAKERDEANDRADAAFAKQLELTERFSETRAQNAQVLERMEQLSEQMRNVLDENGRLRTQVTELSEELHRLRSALQEGNPI